MPSIPRCSKSLRQPRIVSSSRSSASVTCCQLHPLSKSTKAFARRETRQGEDPSRASAVSALRSFSLRNPDCIMRATKSARSKNARNFYRLFNESGYIQNLRVVRILLEPHQLIIDRIQTLVGFRQELPQKIVHQNTPSKH